MNKLIFLILTVLCATILYTCTSPLAVENLPQGVFKSRAIVGSNICLGVTVSNQNQAIKIGFMTNTNSGFISPEIIPRGTDTITGYYPIINFQNGAVSGTITFIDESELKITFQNHNSPYFKMWDVICSTN